MRFSLISSAKIVEAVTPQTNGAGIQGSYVDMSKAARVNVVAVINQGNAAPVSLSFKQAKDSSGTEAKEVTNTVPVWAGQDLTTSDELVRQDNAASFETSATTKHKMVLFQMGASEVLDVNGGFTHLQVNVGASNAANIVSVLYVATDLRYGAQVSLRE